MGELEALRKSQWRSESRLDQQSGEQLDEATQAIVKWQGYLRNREAGYPEAARNSLQQLSGSTTFNIDNTNPLMPELLRVESLLRLDMLTRAFAALKAGPPAEGENQQTYTARLVETAAKNKDWESHREQQQALPRRYTLWMDSRRVVYRDVGPEELEDDVQWTIGGGRGLGPQCSR